MTDHLDWVVVDPKEAGVEFAASSQPQQQVLVQEDHGHPESKQQLEQSNWCHHLKNNTSNSAAKIFDRLGSTNLPGGKIPGVFQSSALSIGVAMLLAPVDSALLTACLLTATAFACGFKAMRAPTEPNSRPRTHAILEIVGGCASFFVLPLRNIDTGIAVGVGLALFIPAALAFLSDILKLRRTPSDNFENDRIMQGVGSSDSYSAVAPGRP